MHPDVDREPDSDVDLLLQQALTAPRGSEDRVVAAALAADEAKRRQLGSAFASRPWLAAAAVLLLLAVFAGAIFRGARPPASHPRSAISGGGVRGVVSNDGAVVIIRTPDQPTIFIGPGGEPPNLPPGAGSIVLLGER